jgi:hypothetical protein
MTKGRQVEMSALKSRWIVAVCLGLWLPLLASGEEGSGQVTPDEPTQVAGSPFHAPIRLAAADGVIDSGPSWGHSGPWVEDVDGDGLRDLVVGDFSGLFRVYRNMGTAKQPRYAVAVNLQAGGVDAKVPIY